MKIPAPLGIALVALFWIGIITWFVIDQNKPAALDSVGTQAAEIPMYDAVGKPVHLSDYKGKVVVLDFWATWCTPCQQALKNLNDTSAKYSGKNVVFLAVNCWDTKVSFKGWLPRYAPLKGITLVIDPTPQGNDAATVDYKVTGLPTQYVIDHNGKVSADFFNGSQQQIEDAIDSALAVHS